MMHPEHKRMRSKTTSHRKNEKMCTKLHQTHTHARATYTQGKNKNSKSTKTLCVESTPQKTRLSHHISVVVTKKWYIVDSRDIKCVREARVHVFLTEKNEKSKKSCVHETNHKKLNDYAMLV